MGEVYRATDARLGRDVAIKVLPAASAQDTDRLARFEREARSVAALSHPNILAIHDIGTALALASILAFLSGLHIYWAFGGRRGWGAAIPQIDGRPAFTPSRLATVLVAVGLAAAALVPLVRIGAFPVSAPLWLSQWSAAALSLIFFVRAVGDFRIVGFFKRIRGTPFAVWDTRLFSPVCLLLAAGFARVATL